MTRRREEKEEKGKEAKGRREEALGRWQDSRGDDMVVVVLGWIWLWGGFEIGCVWVWCFSRGGEKGRKRREKELEGEEGD